MDDADRGKKGAAAAGLGQMVLNASNVVIMKVVVIAIVAGEFVMAMLSERSCRGTARWKGMSRPRRRREADR